MKTNHRKQILHNQKKLKWLLLFIKENKFALKKDLVVLLDLLLLRLSFTKTYFLSSVIV